MALWDTLGSLVGLAGGIYDIYNASKAQQQQQQYYNLAAGSTAVQDAYVQDMLQRMKEAYWPLEDLNIQYQMEDLQSLRPAYQDQLNYQIERLGEQLGQARAINPILDRTELSLINTLTKDEGTLRKELMGQAATDVSLAYGGQRAQDVRSMGLAGINPNSGQFQNYLNRMGQSEALAGAAARTQAARSAEDTALSRQAAALNYAKGAQLPTYGYTPTVSSSGILSGLGQTAGAYTGLAGALGTDAQNQYAGASYLFNQLSQGLFGQGTLLGGK